jgi:hypothetical protein
MEPIVVESFAIMHELQHDVFQPLLHHQLAGGASDPLRSHLGKYWQGTGSRPTQRNANRLEKAMKSMQKYVGSLKEQVVKLSGIVRSGAAGDAKKRVLDKIAALNKGLGKVKKWFVKALPDLTAGKMADVAKAVMDKAKDWWSFVKENVSAAPDKLKALFAKRGPPARRRSPGSSTSIPSRVSPRTRRLSHRLHGSPYI